ncbi:hypothetical protein QO003_000722 [Arthrobacter silviterrae]|uniref:Uncharacterized protein n=1 Tax=Arthrobacter silviterrae TaxID=2026658 RepID=A0ABX0D9L6_9MICC|nr:hypothetical protein [Arthrobacter silviterrae]MDQ0276419.1 hypothetical protein [Arthrobacter silviterrae]NGN82401.1 hypothetical protein [Arthrobacter silviterrae]
MQMIFTLLRRVILITMFYVSNSVHTLILDNFDPDSKLMEIVVASNRHSDRSDWEPQCFSPWQRLLVKVGELHGTVVAYTRSYGLVAWYDDDGTCRLGWFPDARIKRIERRDRHGK